MKVEIKPYKIIYEFFEELDNLSSEEFIDAGLKSNSIGIGKIQEIFSIKKKRGIVQVFGGKVFKGKFIKDQKFRIIRNGEMVKENLKLKTLQRFKEKVDIVEEGLEMGLNFETSEELEQGDEIECYF